MTNFKSDIESGMKGEQIFINNYLIPKNIEYRDVSNMVEYQRKDIDILTRDEMYEIKTNYKDNGKIIVEEKSNIHPLSYGWYYKSKATKIVFISKETGKMIIMNFDDKFKNMYEFIKHDYPEVLNKISYHNGNKWQSSFRIIDLDYFTGMYETYEKDILEDYFFD